MKQQTAVEWLVEQLLKNENTRWRGTDIYELSKQAKEMEKEQIVKAHGNIGWAKPIRDENGVPKMEGITFGMKTGEEYYNETYGADAASSPDKI